MPRRLSLSQFCGRGAHSRWSGLLQRPSTKAANAVESKKVPLISASGEVDGICGISTDITGG
jgi:hypothetical protein